MVEANPFLLLPYSPSEMTRKPGGGNTPAPIVPVTAELREAFARDLSNLAALARDRQATRFDPIPIKIRLRQIALAKSSRPYPMLNSNALPPVAADGPGQLIVGGTADLLNNLASSIRTAASKQDLYFVSTFESFSAWNLESDGFGVPDGNAADEIIRSVRARRSTFKLTFFPWTGQLLQQTISAQAAIAETPGSGTNLVESYARMFGLAVHSATNSLQRPTAYVDADQLPSLDTLRTIHGLREITEVPVYTAGAPALVPTGYRATGSVSSSDFAGLGDTDPLVGVLDSGVDASTLGGAVAAGSQQVPVPEQDATHGTFVGGLIAGAGRLNASSNRFGGDRARIFDGSVLSVNGVPEHLLFMRILKVLDAAPAEIKVWNCSFGAPVLSPQYGSFAQELDILSDSRGVLFITAAGNTAGGHRPWPPAHGAQYDDLLTSPSESIRSVTVGARAHLGGFVPVDAPSSYTRRGPNFANQVKPDVSHWAGDVDGSGNLAGHGIQSALPGGIRAEGLGTSFAAPVVSAVAANVWRNIAEAQATTPTPELVKGVLVHSAVLNSHRGAAMHREARFRHYYGWGTPGDSLEALGSPNDEFTTVHEVTLTPGNDWYKRPLPVPPSLIKNGKFRGEVFLTLSYAPPLNAAFGPEAVRYDVSGAFGSFGVGNDGKEHFHGLTPQEKVWGSKWEEDQIADGKWSPVKTYFHHAPRGNSGGEWALRLSLTERVSEEIQREQRVYAILTLRALDPNLDIYAEGVSEVARLNYSNRVMLSANRVEISNNPSN